MNRVRINITDKRVSLPLEWPYRLLGNLFILCFVFSLAIITVTVREELVKKKFFDLTQKFYEESNKIGFTINDIIIENREKTSLEDIQKILGLDEQKNILSIDVAEVKSKLEELPWVREASVKRDFFPNLVQISLKEKEVAALWQINNKFYPIDEEGKVIEADYTPTQPTLLLVGKGAPENFGNLLEVIKTDAEIFGRIKVASYISERRWNLTLDDIESGITIKLPETELQKTWDKLIEINATKGIFKRKLTIIDLRLPDKVIVKLGKINAGDKNKLKNAKESKI